VRACPSLSSSGNHRPVCNFGPCLQSSASNVGCPNKVRVSLEATPLTKEFALTTTVLFSAVTTLRAGTARVACLHDEEVHARRFALVCDELPELPERPRKPLVSLALTDRCSLVDTFQVFQSECLLAFERLLNKVLGYVVVEPPLIATLSASNPSKVLLRRTGAAHLQALSKRLVFTRLL
jgi:hypothetical protein